jgi:hypothetical protein
LSAIKIKEEKARYAEERKENQRLQIEQVRNRIVQMKEDFESAAQRRFKQSIVNKT